MCSQSWTPLPLLSPYHPSGSSQCTSPKLPASCIKPGLAICFLYDIIHVLSYLPSYSIQVHWLRTKCWPKQNEISIYLFSRWVASDSLRRHGLQHARLPRPSFLEFAHIQVHWVDDAIQLSHPLLSTSPFSFSLCQHQGLFQWVGSSNLVAKVLELSFSFSPFSEYLRLISYRIDWFDLLAVQGTIYYLRLLHCC